MILTRKPGEAFTVVVKYVNNSVNLEIFIEIPNSVYHFRENPHSVGMKNSVVVPSQNCKDFVFHSEFLFHNEFSSHSRVLPTLLTPTIHTMKP